MSTIRTFSQTRITILSAVQTLITFIGGSLGPFALTWAVAALILSWARNVDRKFTYACRLRRRLTPFVWAIFGAGLLIVPLAIAITEFSQESHWVLIVTAVFYAVILSDQISRGYRGIRYERCILEGSLRLGVVAVVGLIPVLSDSLRVIINSQ